MPQRGRRNANQALLIALACGATVDQSAQKAGVSPATVYRRLNDPEFCQQLREMQTDMVQRAAAMLTAAGMESVKTLLELQKPATSGAVRLWGSEGGIGDGDEGAGGRQLGGAAGGAGEAARRGPPGLS